jgi:hypothetical protein
VQINLDDFVIAGQWPNRSQPWPGELTYKNGLRCVREKAAVRQKTIPQKGGFGVFLQ